MRIGARAYIPMLTLGLFGLTDKALPFELSINPLFGSTANTGAAATLTFDFTEQGLDDLITILITNTTPPAIGSRLTAVGLELPDWLIQPPSLVVGPHMGYLDTLTFNESISPGWLDAPGGYDVIFSSDGNFQGGNPHGAPVAGAWEKVAINLGNAGLSPAQLDTRMHDFYSQFIGPSVIARFQAVGSNAEGSDIVAGGVPEPASIVLLALGGLSLLRRNPGIHA